jgi:hypothetical protein
MDKQIQVRHGKHVEFRSIPVQIFRDHDNDDDHDDRNQR